MNPRFVFESELYATLEFMPLGVRHKLDVAGLKLSLKQWQRLPRAAREALCDAPVETAAQVDAFRSECERSCASVGEAVAVIAPAPTPRPWDSDAARRAVVERAEGLGLRVDEPRWSGLAEAQRYALARLSAPGKDEAKLRAALAEFELLA